MTLNISALERAVLRAFVAALVIAAPFGARAQARATLADSAVPITIDEAIRRARQSAPASIQARGS